MAIFDAQFYNRDTLTVAQDLLGKYFVRNSEGGPIISQITETEAYIGRRDKACHAFGYRKTERTKTLFLAPGHAYIYLIYGMHCCFNFVTEPEGEPCAVLLRGLSSCHGGERMARNRFGVSPSEMTSYQKKNFLNGPGKACAALELGRSLNGRPCVSAGDAFYVCDSLSHLGFSNAAERVGEIQCGPRVGVGYAGEDALLPWRFWIERANIF